MTTSIHDVPSEILIQIFSKLGLTDLPNVARVCNFWRLLANEKIIWSSLSDNEEDIPCRKVELDYLTKSTWLQHQNDCKILASQWETCNFLVVDNDCPKEKINIINRVCSKTNRMYIDSDSISMLKKARTVSNFLNSIIIVCLMMVLLFTSFVQDLVNEMGSWMKTFSPIMVINIMALVHMIVSWFISDRNTVISSCIGGSHYYLTRIPKQNRLRYFIATMLQLLSLILIPLSLDGIIQNKYITVGLVPHWIGIYLIHETLKPWMRTMTFNRLRSYPGTYQPIISFYGTIIILILQEILIISKIDSHVTTPWYLVLFPTLSIVGSFSMVLLIAMIQMIVSIDQIINRNDIIILTSISSISFLLWSSLWLLIKSISILQEISEISLIISNLSPHIIPFQLSIILSIFTISHYLYFTILPNWDNRTLLIKLQ